MLKSNSTIIIDVGTDDSQESEPSVQHDVEISLMNVDSHQLDPQPLNSLNDDYDLQQHQPPTPMDVSPSNSLKEDHDSQPPTPTDVSPSNSVSDESQQSDPTTPLVTPPSNLVSDVFKQLEPPTMHDALSSSTISDDSQELIDSPTGLESVSNTGICICHNMCVLIAFGVALLSIGITTFSGYCPSDISFNSKGNLTEGYFNDNSSEVNAELWPNLQWNSSYREVLDLLTKMQNCSDTIKELNIGDSVKTFELISNELHQIKSRLVNRYSVNVGIVGLSGAGKRTFLNALLGKSFLPSSMQAQIASKVVIVHDEGKTVEELYCSTEGNSILLVSGQKAINHLLMSWNDEVRELNQDRDETAVSKCHKLALHVPLQFLNKSDVQHVKFEIFRGFGEDGVVKGVNTAIKDASAIVVILDSSKLKSLSESKLFEDLKHYHSKLFSTLIDNNRLLILVNPRADVYSQGKLTHDNASIPPENLPAYVLGYIKGPDYNLSEISSKQILHFNALWALKSREWKDPRVFSESENAEILYQQAMLMLRYTSQGKDADNLQGNMNDENIKKTSSLLEPISQIQVVEDRLRNIIERGASDLLEGVVNDAISAIESLLSLPNVSTVIEDVSEASSTGEEPEASLKCAEKLRKLIEHLV